MIDGDIGHVHEALLDSVKRRTGASMGELEQGSANQAHTPGPARKPLKRSEAPKQRAQLRASAYTLQVRALSTLNTWFSLAVALRVHTVSSQ